MRLKRQKKTPLSNPWPLAAAGVAALGAIGCVIALLLRSRNRLAKAKGAAYEATAPVRQAGREYDDVTLARKVESEVLGGEDAPKGSVVVNAQDGIVELRGEVKRPEDVKALGAAAAKVAGVKDVNNLLHTPGSEPKTSPVSDPAAVRERAEQS